jgi:hypothetical protein
MPRRSGARLTWPADPFRVLGLDPRADLTDDDVRAAWRRIATAAHPDRADGGDPQRFTNAAAAYTELRTAVGRGEARADMHVGDRARPRLRRAGGAAGRELRLVWLTLRVAATAVAGYLALLAAGNGPAGPALVTGALTWLAVSISRDIGRPGLRR